MPVPFHINEIIYIYVKLYIYNIYIIHCAGNAWLALKASTHYIFCKRKTELIKHTIFPGLFFTNKDISFFFPLKICQLV